ncbi:MAG: non-hydrolyzing UDP-N-acetylglucosamine 2-epimerase [Planctomycetota bacterium]|jgi:UDP-N-acetylglucosamine 2-epimerase (non-hydrolysing)
MKILTILGTRPEIIRLSLIIPKLDRLCQHVLAHTGQNFSRELSEIFFEELGLRKPDYFWGVRTEPVGEQIGDIISQCEGVLLKEKPDRLLLLGDTNSALSAIMAKRMGIPVYHMEAGNRCYDDRVPEEVNRRIIDHSSDVLMPYTERSRANMIREGIEGERIHAIGNPIYEVIAHYETKINDSKIMSQLDLKKSEYFLITMHRQENVDDKNRLYNLVEALILLEKKYEFPVICSLHPRTKNRIADFGINVNHENIRFLAPLGFFDFVNLERNAFCVISDSGTVQEECCIFKVPNVTIRDTTERPETIECGSNILSGTEPKSIVRCVRTVLEQKPNWMIPPEYIVENVSNTVIKIILGHR